MKSGFVVMLLIAALAMTSFDAQARSKKCKAGYEYDPVIGKCVPAEGS